MPSIKFWLRQWGWLCDQLRFRWWCVVQKQESGNITIIKSRSSASWFNLTQKCDAGVYSLNINNPTVRISGWIVKKYKATLLRWPVVDFHCTFRLKRKGCRDYFFFEVVCAAFFTAIFGAAFLGCGLLFDLFLSIRVWFKNHTKCTIEINCWFCVSKKLTKKF